MHMRNEVAFELIVPECEILNFEGGWVIQPEKIEPLQKLGVHIWKKGLADAIQTSFEADGGCYNLVHVLKREKIMIHPFAVISANIAAEFDNRNFEGKVLCEIGNNGVLIK